MSSRSGLMMQAVVRSCQARSLIQLVPLRSVISKVTKECGGCGAAEAGSSRKHLATASLRGSGCGVCVRVPLIKCVLACRRWTPTGQASWSWIGSRDRSLLPTVRCTWPCCPSSSRSCQVITVRPATQRAGPYISGGHCVCMTLQIEGG